MLSVSYRVSFADQTVKKFLYRTLMYSLCKKPLKIGFTSFLYEQKYSPSRFHIICMMKIFKIAEFLEDQLLKVNGCKEKNFSSS